MVKNVKEHDNLFQREDVVMMKDKSAWGWICCAAWLISAIGAINWGLVALDADIFTLVPMLNPIKLVSLYIIGIAGVISLIGWIQCVAEGCKVKH